VSRHIQKARVKKTESGTRPLQCKDSEVQTEANKARRQHIDGKNSGGKSFAKGRIVKRDGEPKDEKKRENSLERQHVNSTVSGKGKGSWREQKVGRGNATVLTRVGEI